MQRYILDSKTKTFYDSDITHILKVMRMKNDDLVIVCLDEECSIARLKISGKNVSYELVENIETPKTKNITLIQGVLKGSKIETTIKYSTIFGVRNIILVPFERSITSKIKNEDHKLNRYFNIAKEAAELSHRSSIPNLDFYNNLKDIEWDNYDYVILADELEKENSLDNVLKNNIDNKSVAIVIGPEGGITDNERLYFENIKALKITLGNFIFPAEIASISLLAQLK